VGFYPLLGLFAQKWAFWALLGPAARGFYINPSRRGPAVPRGGVGPRRGSEGEPLSFPGGVVRLWAARGALTGSCKGLVTNSRGYNVKTTNSCVYP